MPENADMFSAGTGVFQVPQSDTMFGGNFGPLKSVPAPIQVLCTLKELVA